MTCIALSKWYFMRAVELFAGAGGFAIGMHQAGIQTATACEIDPRHSQTYARNFPKTTVITGDVRSLSFGLGSFDLIYGGPPCQSFSIMGRRRADDPRSNLLGEFARIVNEVKPKNFVMENVPGLISGHQRLWFDKFLQQIPGCYHMTTSILNAADYGTTQNRHRLFVIGSLVSAIAFPNPFPQKMTVRQAIADLQDFADTIHNFEVVARFQATAPGQREPISRFVRLDWDGQAPTLRAGTDRTANSKNGGHTAARPIHPNGHRVVNLREFARLQAFPDSYQFHSVKMIALRQIGNSVPPPLAKAIGEAISDIVPRTPIQ